MANKYIGQNLQEKVQNSESGRHHQFLHIQISSKFQFQQTILIVLEQTSQKRILLVENKKVNGTIQFFIFGLV